MLLNVKVEIARNQKTISDVAKYMGVSTNTLSFKISGKREFTLSELEKLSDMFGCSIDYLAGLTEQRARAS